MNNKNKQIEKHQEQKKNKTPLKKHKLKSSKVIPWMVMSVIGTQVPNTTTGQITPTETTKSTETKNEREIQWTQFTEKIAEISATKKAQKIESEIKESEYWKFYFKEIIEKKPEEKLKIFQLLESIKTKNKKKSTKIMQDWIKDTKNKKVAGIIFLIDQKLEESSDGREVLETAAIYCPYGALKNYNEYQKRFSRAHKIIESAIEKSNQIIQIKQFIDPNTNKRTITEDEYKDWHKQIEKRINKEREEMQQWEKTLRKNPKSFFENIAPNISDEILGEILIKEIRELATKSSQGALKLSPFKINITNSNGRRQSEWLYEDNAREIGIDIVIYKFYDKIDTEIFQLIVKNSDLFIKSPIAENILLIASKFAPKETLENYETWEQESLEIQKNTKYQAINIKECYLRKNPKPLKQTKKELTENYNLWRQTILEANISEFTKKEWLLELELKTYWGEDFYIFMQPEETRKEHEKQFKILYKITQDLTTQEKKEIIERISVNIFPILKFENAEEEFIKLIKTGSTGWNNFFTTKRALEQIKNVPYFEKLVDAWIKKTSPEKRTLLYAISAIENYKPEIANKLKKNLEQKKQSKIRKIYVQNSLIEEDEELIEKDPAFQHIEKIDSTWSPNITFPKRETRTQKTRNTEELDWKIMIGRNLFLKNFPKEQITEEIIQKAIENIIQKRKSVENLEILKDRTVLYLKGNSRQKITIDAITFLKTKEFGTKTISDLIKKQIGPKKELKIFEAENTKESAQKTKETYLNAIATTPGPITIIIDGHGNYLGDIELGTYYKITTKEERFLSKYYLSEAEITSEEIAEALLKRQKNGHTEKVIMINFACQSQNIMRLMYEKIKENNGQTPIIISSSEYLESSILTPNRPIPTWFYFGYPIDLNQKDPITMKDIIKNEDLIIETGEGANATIFIPDENETIEQIAKNEPPKKIIEKLETIINTIFEINNQKYKIEKTYISSLPSQAKEIFITIVKNNYHQDPKTWQANIKKQIQNFGAMPTQNFISKKIEIIIQEMYDEIIEKQKTLES